MARYLEDLKPGDAFESKRHTITQDAIIAFAREYDPQPFHTDPVAAKALFFGRLIGSGWHTAALTMRLLNETQMDLAYGVVGAGVDDLRWPTPLVPDDVIRVRVEIIETRASKSRPEIGIVRARVRTLRDDDTPVQEMVANLIVPAKPGSG
jgi:acyl dehydratase